MRMRIPFFFCVAMLFSLAIFASCVEVKEPEAPAIEIPESEGECSNYCDCDPADVIGRAFRLNVMRISEPNEFADILNRIWENDIRNNVLNVLFVITEAARDEGAPEAFSSIAIEAGPGWRSPAEPRILKPEEGQETSDYLIDSYCHLEGMAETFHLEPKTGYQCTVKSSEAGSLFFHSGPLDNPIICAPDAQPANNIPISNLRIRASFNEDCTGITNGYLEGCLTVENADRICMCVTPDLCGDLFDETVDFEEFFDEEAGLDNLDGYCKAACGNLWSPFGDIGRAAGLSPNCLTPEGKEGYRVQGDFTAIDITDKFNPVQSGDCTETR